MIEKLKRLLKNAIVEEFDTSLKNIVQYETLEGELLILRKEKLTPDQINLLNIFLNRIENNGYSETMDQKFWKALVNGEKPPISNATITAPFYQFIHFSINDELQNKADFEEALQNFFTYEITVVWRSSTDGFLVLYITEDILEDEDETSTMTDAVMSDFLIKLTIYKGEKFTNIEDGLNIFQWEDHVFSVAKQFLPKASTVSKEQLIPYIVANEVSQETKQKLTASIQLLLEDKELMKTIKVFLECNLNTTLAAKRLFMHRNSLQYRIDKFIEKTNIDIKQFQHAAALHILIALLET